MYYMQYSEAIYLGDSAEQARYTPRLLSVGERCLYQKEILSGGKVDALYRIAHPLGYTVAINCVDIQARTSNGTDYSYQRLIALDHNNHNQEVGIGIVKYAKDNPRPFFANKPFVEHTETFDLDLRGKGYAKQRLIALNALTFVIYGRFLHSSTLFVNQHAEQAWKSHVEAGLAKPYTETDIGNEPVNRYRFVEPT